MDFELYELSLGLSKRCATFEYAYLSNYVQSISRVSFFCIVSYEKSFFGGYFAEFSETIVRLLGVALQGRKQSARVQKST